MHTKYDCMNTGMVPLCILLRKELGYRAEGCMEEDWDETLSYCVVLNYPCLTEIHASIVLDIIIV